MAHALKDAQWWNGLSDFDYVNQQSVFTQNMVRYTTPTFNGLKASVQHSFGEVAGQTSQNKSDSILVNYAVNNFTLAAGYKKVKDVFGDGYDNKLTYIGGTYTQGPFKLAATYHKTKWSWDGGHDDTKTTEFGAAYTINPKLVAAVNYVSQKAEWDGSDKATITSASLKYSLSKRTSLWTLASRTNNKNQQILGGNYVNALTNEKSNSYSLGVTHSF